MSFFRELTWLDWIILLCLGVSIISSVLKGFAREIISLISVLVGLLLASWFYPVSSRFFARYAKTEEIASLLGFATIFFACIGAGILLSIAVTKFLKAANLKWFDRFLGAAFGLMRGWLIAAVLFLILTAFPVELEMVRNAKLSPYFLAGARALAIITPRELKIKFLEGYRRIEKLWEEHARSSG